MGELNALAGGQMPVPSFRTRQIKGSDQGYTELFEDAGADSEVVLIFKPADLTRVEQLEQACMAVGSTKLKDIV